TTQYEKLQIDAQVASVKQLEEQAWTAYVQASNALVNLLDLEGNTLLLPAGYTANLSEQTKLSTTDAYTVALDNRPDLKSQRITGRASEIQVKFARNQVKPDLKYSPSVSFAQNPSPFGFKSWEQSWSSLMGFGEANKNIVNVPVKPNPSFPPASAYQLKAVPIADETSGPDTKIMTNTLTYNWPVRNRALKAALTIAVANRDMQDISIQSTERQVEQDVGDAIVGLLSAKTQNDIAQEQYKLADTQYKQALEMMGAGRITEFELISRSADLLAADQGKVAAATAYKKAESELLWAEGILPNTYAGMRAQNDVEGDRLEALAATKALHFFKPMPLPIAGPDADPPAPKTAAKE
ncbi:MAG: TolC family protein, partial [Planctomycetota bacterium]